MQLDVNGKRDVTGKRLDFLYLPENRTFHDRSQSIGSVPKELKKIWIGTFGLPPVLKTFLQNNC
jgi:hypothetical protein